VQVVITKIFIICKY